MEIPTNSRVALNLRGLLGIPFQSSPICKDFHRILSNLVESSQICKKSVILAPGNLRGAGICDSGPKESERNPESVILAPGNLRGARNL